MGRLTAVYILSLSIMAVIAGCSSDKPSKAYPIDKMVDPVTQETPNVVKAP